MKVIIKHFLSLKQSYLENSLLTLNKKYFCPSHKNLTNIVKILLMNI